MVYKTCLLQNDFDEIEFLWKLINYSSHYNKSIFYSLLHIHKNKSPSWGKLVFFYSHCMMLFTWALHLSGVTMWISFITFCLLLFTWALPLLPGVTIVAFIYHVLFLLFIRCILKPQGGANTFFTSFHQSDPATIK